MDYQFKKRNLLILAIITSIIIYFSVQGELSSIVLILKNVNVLWLLMAVVCIVLYWIFEAKTLHIMLQTYDENFSFKEVLKLVVSTQFFNGITPFSTGGQPFQIYVLSKRSTLTISSITSASIHNFIIYQTVLVIMGTIAIITRFVFNIFPTAHTGLSLLAFSGFGLNLIIIIALIIITVSPKLTDICLHTIFSIIHRTPLKKHLPKIRIKWTKNVSEFHKDILVLMSNKDMYLKALGLNTLKLLSFYTIAYFISLAVGFDAITILQALIASAYVMLITSVVPLPGASGGAEMGFLVFFGAFIIGPNATAIMLLWRFITYYIGLFAGIATFYLGYRTPA